MPSKPYDLNNQTPDIIVAVHQPGSSRIFKAARVAAPIAANTRKKFRSILPIILTRMSPYGGGGELAGAIMRFAQAGNGYIAMT